MKWVAWGVKLRGRQSAQLTPRWKLYKYAHHRAWANEGRARVLTVVAVAVLTRTAGSSSYARLHARAAEVVVIVEVIGLLSVRMRPPVTSL